MLEKDILTIRKALDNNEVTKEDLVNEFKSKYEKLNSDLNAFNLLVDEENNEHDNTLLTGIPYSLKDNISTKGIRTTSCSNTLKNYVPVYDATVYEKLKKSGAVLVGKVNMDELAMGGTGTTGNTGEVHNPWNLECMAGGSSAGSAASVASGMVPFSIGSDTGDSIRKPAAYCGVVGFKPSYGLISRYGLFAFASSLDHVGVFARNVVDTAVVTDVIKGYDEKDMTSIKDMDEVSLYDSLNNNVNGKKLFYIKEICDPSLYTDEVTKNILNSFNDTLEKIKSLGIKVEEVSIDKNLLNAIKPIYDCISCAEVTSNNSNLTGVIFGSRGDGKNIYDVMKDHRTKGFSSLIKRRFVIGSYVLQKENQEKYFLNAKRVRRLLVDKFNELFEEYDGCILPCSGGTAPELKMASNKISRNDVILENHMAIANFGGYPSITIPNGFEGGMPIGINITGKFKDDANVLCIAKHIEDKLEYKNMCAGGEK